jgi:hypothetical protein
MVLNLIRRAIDDVNSAPIGFPPRDASGEMRIGVGESLVVFFLKLVLLRTRVWIAALPEGYDENVPVGIRRELAEVGTLLIRDDVANVLVQPFLIRKESTLFRRSLCLFSGPSTLILPGCETQRNAEQEREQ